MDIIKEILLWPPYLIFVFLSSVFMVASLISNNYFDKIWIFFLYSVAGSIWRYIEKDIDHGVQKIIKKETNRDICHLVVIVIYHIGNIVLIFALLRYLELI